MQWPIKGASQLNHLVKALILSTLVFHLSSCESIRYYGQAAQGQMEILWKRQPIEDVIEQNTLSDEIKTKLEFVLEVREFAESNLSLKVGKQYSTYVDLERPYVVWNVFAAPEFSVEAHNWCYPIVGCAAYRGYFSEKAALKYEAQFKEQGFDTYVGGIAAYSTLGWFNDSILNTFIKREETRLAGLIFHELAHQRLYFKGDSTFNESFATVVEQHGIRLWKAHKNLSTDLNQPNLSKIRQDFVDLVLDTRSLLQEVYQQPISDEAKREKKAAIIESMIENYQQIKQEQWQGYSGYDRWFNTPINNAKLSTVATYHSLVPELFGLLKSLNYEVSAFYSHCEQLEDMDKDERHESLSVYGS